LTNFSNTAIVIFSNTSVKELECKSFYNKEFDKKIHQEFLKKTIKTAADFSSNYFVESSLVQKGDSFGERISNSIEKYYNKGYENVIVVGSDTLGLNQSHLIEATSLTSKNLVLGKSKDGGVYLIGVNKDQYKRQLFLDLDWQKSTLHESFSNSFSSIFFLEELNDVDTKEDFLQLDFKAINLVSFIISLFKTFELTFVLKLNEIYNRFLPQAILLRGPPVCF
jgi:glycosyltransferase A (GT-A) superfamily protein (DUF2064 family)